MPRTNGGPTGPDSRINWNSADRPKREDRILTPLQAELIEDGIDPDPDMLSDGLPRADIAPEVGYGERGPEPLGGPVFSEETSLPKVYQWEIDPANVNAESGTASIDFDGWEFNIWWQVHPADLVYVTIQAMCEDKVEHAGGARPHPVGRSEAVNLVYDFKREGVVAIYGTVKDFRPFVVAFHKGFNRAATREGAGAGDEIDTATSAEGGV